MMKSAIVSADIPALWSCFSFAVYMCQYIKQPVVAVAAALKRKL